MSNGANPQTEMTLAEAKEKIIAYCKKRGALTVGVADVEILERTALPGHGPRALMPRVRAVVSIGVGGSTQMLRMFAGVPYRHPGSVGRSNSARGAADSFNLGG